MDTEKRKKRATVSSVLGKGIPGGMASLINEADNRTDTTESPSPGKGSIEKLLRHYKEKGGRTPSSPVYVDEEARDYLTKIRSTRYFGQFTTGQIVSAIVTRFFNENKEEIKSELLSSF